MNDWSGRSLGPYSILEPIGGGGMAVVYKAYQPGADRYVALKLIRADFSRDPQLRQRFEREARLIARLEHPSILPVYDVGEQDGVPYLVMRYVDGGTLSDKIAAGALPIRQAIEYVVQIGDALAYAHHQGVIHRDIKPANVLITPRGHVLLSDFGIAKILADDSGLTATGMPIGTPYYMAPEQIKGGTIDSRTDLYSLGILLYEAITGTRPFLAETPWAVMDMQVRDPLPPPRTMRPDITSGLERVILKATAKDPSDRFQSVEEMLSGLHRVLAELDEPAGASGGPVQHVPQTALLQEAPNTLVMQPVARSWRVWRWPLLGAGALALLAVLVLVRPWQVPAGSDETARRITPDAPPAQSTTVAAATSADAADPATVAVATSAPAAEPTPESTAAAGGSALRYTFDDGDVGGWEGLSEQWRVLMGSDGGVYEGEAPADSFSATAPPESAAQLGALGDYAVELRARVVAPGPADDDFADFWISMRAQSDVQQTGGCESYSFFFDSANSSQQLALVGQGDCAFHVLASADEPLLPDIWYTLRIEVQNRQLRLLVDGKPVAQADDDRLERGFFYLTLGPGARVQFDDIALLPYGQ